MLVGQKKVTIAILSLQEIKREDEEPTRDEKQQKRKGLSPTKDDRKWSKKRRPYTNWFQFHLWPPIAIAITKIGNNSRALHFSKITFKMPNVPSPYEKLSRGMIMGVVHYKW